MSPAPKGKIVAEVLEPTEAGQRRRKALAIALWVLALVLLAAVIWWYLVLPDEDPGEPMIKDVAEEVAD